MKPCLAIHTQPLHPAMKTNQLAATTAAAIIFSLFVSAPCEAAKTTTETVKTTNKDGSITTSTITTTVESIPEEPSGWLSATPKIVSTGSYPTLTWGINHPAIVTDYVTVSETSFITKETVDYEIRVLGAGVTSGSGKNLTFIPTEATFSYGGGAYSRIFYGTNSDVKKAPNDVVKSGTFTPGTQVKFGGRYYYNNKWASTYTSDSSGKNVRVLVNGQKPPAKVPANGAPSLESFLAPVLNANGKVNIGPLDMIVFMELTHTDEKDSGYDLQDMVLLVTVKSKVTTEPGKDDGRNK